MYAVSFPILGCDAERCPPTRPGVNRGINGKLFISVLLTLVLAAGCNTGALSLSAIERA
ncbi:hypothetical protein BH11GEM2_BH11GEM2_15880 [soil metagenome]|jgi:hypothetical protein